MKRIISILMLIVLLFNNTFFILTAKTENNDLNEVQENVIQEDNEDVSDKINKQSDSQDNNDNIQNIEDKVAKQTPKSKSDITISFMNGVYFRFGSNVPAPFTNRVYQYEYMRTNEGVPAYCVEFGIVAGTGTSSHIQYDDLNYLTSSQKELITQILLYGFRGAAQYGFSPETEYRATQQ